MFKDMLLFGECVLKILDFGHYVRMTTAGSEGARIPECRYSVKHGTGKALKVSYTYPLIVTNIAMENDHLF